MLIFFFIIGNFTLHLYETRTISGINILFKTLLLSADDFVSRFIIFRTLFNDIDLLSQFIYLDLIIFLLIALIVDFRILIGQLFFVRLDGIKQIIDLLLILIAFILLFF